jgi:hypothetical protein
MQRYINYLSCQNEKVAIFALCAYTVVDKYQFYNVFRYIFIKIVCAHNYFVVPLHRQKEIKHLATIKKQRLFRLVEIIDLGLAELLR